MRKHCLQRQRKAMDSNDDAGLSCGDHISSTTKDEKEEKGKVVAKEEPTGDGESRSPQQEATVHQMRQGNPLTAESEDLPSHVPETSSEKHTTDLKEEDAARETTVGLDTTPAPHNGAERNSTKGIPKTS
ncbi:hypothetical protein TcYC6_0007590 [Trypanosoma cruzi]|nr:hypothetical protein TcYC6_0007590 [Trypanosoma cruzi]